MALNVCVFQLRTSKWKLCNLKTKVQMFFMTVRYIRKIKTLIKNMITLNFFALKNEKD